jgi:hypothetical protein
MASFINPPIYSNLPTTISPNHLTNPLNHLTNLSLSRLNFISLNLRLPTPLNFPPRPHPHFLSWDFITLNHSFKLISK